MARLLSGFIEASSIIAADSGGTKVDQILPSPGALKLSAEEGFGNVPFHRTEFTARDITAYFNLDLALLRGYGLPNEAEKLLITLSLFKILRFLDVGLRLRTACDLQIESALTVTRPNGFTMPTDAKELLKECAALIGACKPHFADPAITEVEWKPSKKVKGKKDTDDEGAAEESVGV